MRTAKPIFSPLLTNQLASWYEYLWQQSHASRNPWQHRVTMWPFPTESTALIEKLTAPKLARDFDRLFLCREVLRDHGYLGFFAEDSLVSGVTLGNQLTVLFSKDLPNDDDLARAVLRNRYFRFTSCGPSYLQMLRTLKSGSQESGLDLDIQDRTAESKS